MEINAYLKENLPRHIDDLLSFKVSFKDEDVKNYSLYVNSSAVQEILHLVMKYTFPHLKKNKYEFWEFKRNLLISGKVTSKLINRVPYSQITS